MTDLQEKLRDQKQRVKQYEEALRGAGGAGKSGETSVEAGAQIDSKVRRIRRHQCVLFVIQYQFTLLHVHVGGTVLSLHPFPPPPLSPSPPPLPPSPISSLLSCLPLLSSPFLISSFLSSPPSSPPSSLPSSPLLFLSSSLLSSSSPPPSSHSPSSPLLFLSSSLLSSLLFSSSQPTQHHSAEVLKWEESKRWQKRLEGLRTKLTEKNRELEAAQRQIKALKETLARCVS